MSSNAEIVKKVFELTKEPSLHVDEIAAHALRLNLIAGDAKEVAKKLNGYLAANVKGKKDFKKARHRITGNKKGCYAPASKKARAPNVDVRQDEVGTSFKGRAGEYGVISELMFRGYDATILPVDNGIDVIAKKDGKYFHIQVKTARESGGKFQFSIKKNAFEANAFVNTFYAFCLRRSARVKGVDQHFCEYFIFHNHEIQRLIHIGVISEKNQYSVRIHHDGRNYVLNDKEVVNHQQNHFKQIA